MSKKSQGFRPVRRCEECDKPLREENHSGFCSNCQSDREVNELMKERKENE